jgi:hypothetical protein
MRCVVQAALATLCLAGVVVDRAVADPIVRIASYNIRFLDAGNLPSQRRRR